MDSECDHMVRHCQACQASAKSTLPSGEPNMTRIERPSEPWHRAGLDIADPFNAAPTVQHYIVTIIDHHSQYPECLLMNDIMTNRIIRWLKDVFAHFGNPDQLVTDNGPQFVSAIFISFLRDPDIKHLCTANYNPQETAAVETFNKMLKHAVQVFHSEKTTWETGIRELLMQYRVTPATPDGKSPAQAFLGHNICCNFQPVLRK